MRSQTGTPRCACGRKQRRFGGSQSDLCPSDLLRLAFAVDLCRPRGCRPGLRTTIRRGAVVLIKLKENVQSSNQDLVQLYAQLLGLFSLKRLPLRSIDYGRL